MSADTNETEMNKNNARQQNHCCISHEFFHTATRNPTKIAVVHATLSNQNNDNNNNDDEHDFCFTGDKSFTCADILGSVEYLSSRLTSALHGDRSGDSSGVCVSRDSQCGYMPKIVGICMPPSVEYIVSVLSVLRCGEAFLPLDPWWPKERILSIISSSSVQHILVSGSGFGTNDSNRVDKWHWILECVSCPVLFVSMQECLQKKVSLSNLVWPCESERQREFCYLMYTSGSTGKPKGVCGTEQGLLNRFLWMQELYPLNGEEIILFKTSISFVDHLQEFLGAILTACTLIIPPFSVLKDNVFSILDFLQVYSVSRLIAVPSLMRAVFPAFESPQYMQVRSSLKLLVLSGEVLPISLWKMVASALPNTSILNLYGSTEVSGDCAYFDCKRLSEILEMEELTSVPIGIPIFNCDVILSGEEGVSDRGQMCVSGVCVCRGYFSGSTYISPEYINLCQNSSHDKNAQKLYFKTGDFARRLQSGDLVFLGRKDRTIKVNGQRIALEEIECTLRAHPSIIDAAVLSCKGPGETVHLVAFLILKESYKYPEVYSSIKTWLVDRLPVAMIPNRYVFTVSFPMSSSGKVDYEMLASSSSWSVHVKDEVSDFTTTALLQIVKKAFCDALMIEEISEDDDFFALGGTSISAAHVSYNLGIDMRLIYNFPTPSKLQDAIRLGEGSSEVGFIMKVDSGTSNLQRNEPNNDSLPMRKKRKVHSDAYGTSKVAVGNLWNGESLPVTYSITRCNRIINRGNIKENDICQATWSVEVPWKREGHMQELWKVNLGSCVDASPTIVFKGLDVYLLIGSHSHKFMCIDARSGNVQWEIKLGGRVECSAAVVDDFSQVVVGCYTGKIYFLGFTSGKINWTFQTSGEVKSQPVLDIRRQLVWCGAHDHNLYALDYKNHCCAYKHACGGSVFGSPAIDEERDALYVTSTSGRITALSLKDSLFNILWQHELGVPVFGSVIVCPPNGNVICCLVDGHVIALDSSGSIIWKSSAGGPIFAGASITPVLPSQVLVCCRNGHVYSFQMESGKLIWEYDVGDPITASAYVDENLQLMSNHEQLLSHSQRLVCVCTSSGGVHILRVDTDAGREAMQPTSDAVEEFASLNLHGDIFSSPVMIGGRIFVGCRDDNIYGIAVEFKSSM